ncbi:class I SAM-dependent methyltransferase [Pelobacter propionicus]|uniref:Methyltransferase type 12 n=1 Tax=Pelobacter propionicus (strain DSM 2379 / NBRC 103807 / OttBd1) TaxID=338966 RepID=A1AKX4_PELPD|nr:class I SAM-dependent methyltransferase [Pelobacter propionicus]ABK97994.1 Methyltransferase type 12 [Pelobacter propionicus DSM 2379]
MNLMEKATIIHFHRHRIRGFPGGSVGALGWRGEENQSRRFRVIAGAGDFSGRSILDLGCGHGDLVGYLSERFSGFAYVGIDMMAEFLEVALERHGQRPDTVFYRADFTRVELPRADYVFASGALGYRCDDPGFYREMIARMYAAAERALIFNMLDAEFFPEHELLTGHDRAEVVTFCHELSPRVELIRGYLEDDFTVCMYR